MVIDTRQFVYCGRKLCEERDGTGTLTKEFFARGQTTSGTTNKYLYEMNFRGDVCSVTDLSGNSVSEITYDNFGRPRLSTGSFVSDFGFASMFQHSSSGLNLTLFRVYSPNLGCWLTRDPINQNSGSNLYSYANNNPVSMIDPIGLDAYGIPADQLARELGVSIDALRGGCFDIVNAALKMPPGNRPDNYKTTQCYFGTGAEGDAQAYVKKDCECDGVVWSKRGRPYFTPKPGKVDPNVIRNQPSVDYTTLWTGGGAYNNMYIDMSGAAPGGTGYATRTPRSVGSEWIQIWCGTCRKGN